MTREDILEVLNTLNTLYPMAFNNLSSERRREIYITQFTKQLGDLKLVDVQSAIDKWVSSDESGKSPTLSVIKTMAKRERNKRQSKEGNSTLRIETPEEVMANIFHEEMKKPREKRNYDLLDRTKYYAGLFQDEQAYIKHFGKPREEYERM